MTGRPLHAVPEADPPTPRVPPHSLNDFDWTSHANPLTFRQRIGRALGCILVAGCVIAVLYGFILLTLTIAETVTP